MKSIESTFGIGRLIAKHLTDALDAGEQNQLDAWLKEDEKHRAIFNRIIAHESLAAALVEMQQVNTELALVNVKSRMGTLAERKTVRLWPRMAVAAVAAAIVVGVYFFIAPKGNRHAEFISASQQDIAAGKNGATITLANGKVIQLSDAKSGVIVGQDLKYSDGVEILTPKELRNKTVKGDEQGGERSVMLTASTAKAQTYQFTLSDGTKVWLNSDSKISFPAQFSSKGRKILLEGEGYFEVAKDKAHPFIVTTDKQEVEVLGTHFNISAYQDEATKTTLLEGSVKVNTLEQTGSVIRKGFSEVLKPNQQAILIGNKLDVTTANIEQVIAWKNGKFAFNKQSLQDIMQGIARWYNVEVVYEPGFVSRPFTGSISRFQNISTVLHVLELTGTVHFRVEGRRVTVMP